MDIDPVLGLERAKGRGALDRFEVERMDFFHRTRDMYLQLCAERVEMKKVDASQELELVHQELKEILTSYLA